MNNNEFEIAGQKIGHGRPVYIIAEMSANHNQDFEQAVALIKAAKDSGADAIKLQTYTPDTITLDVDTPPFRIEGTIWNGQTLHSLYAKAYTPWEWFPRLQKIAKDEGLDFFSSPFDPTAVEFLESLAVPAYKVASFELVDLPLLELIAHTGKPIIMSTGMASLAEIDEAIQAIRNTGNNQLALLKCTSAYPAPLEEMNLKTMPHIAATFGVHVGISDHTMDSVVPVAATALGAAIIEKHLTLSRSVNGPDSSFSMEPAEFERMVQAVRETEKSLGQISYEVTEQQRACKFYRRSLFAVQDIRQGEEITSLNVRSIRPGNGLHPRFLHKIIGKNARVNIAKGTPLEWNLLD